MNIDILLLCMWITFRCKGKDDLELICSCTAAPIVRPSESKWNGISEREKKEMDEIKRHTDELPAGMKASNYVAHSFFFRQKYLPLWIQDRQTPWTVHVDSKILPALSKKQFWLVFLFWHNKILTLLHKYKMENLLELEKNPELEVENNEDPKNSYLCKK